MYKNILVQRLKNGKECFLKIFYCNGHLMFNLSNIETFKKG